MTTRPDAGGEGPQSGKATSPGDGAGPSPAVDESTGLPGLRSWRAVYTVVIGLFVVWVGLLTWLTAYYS